MKKKLLHIVLYLVYGGLEKIVYDFSKELNGVDYEVHVAALEKGGPIGDMLLEEGIPVHVLGRRPGKFDFNLLINLIKLIKKHQIDIIHSHSACIMYAALAGKMAGVPIIIHTEHGKYIPEPKLRILEERIFSHLITTYVCVSKELERYVSSITKIPKRKIKTIINGIDTSRFFKYSNDEKLKLREKFNIPTDSLLLGTVSRLNPSKNVTFLIAWFRQNYLVYDNLVLMITGAGPQQATLKEKAKGIPKDRIRFLGAREDVPDLMNIFDIFTLVSSTEGTSLTILEAMATQLPVIVSNVGGNNSIVSHKENGLLFEFNNEIEFSRCINKVIKEKAFSLILGKKARETVLERFSLDLMINNYCRLYQLEEN